MSSPNILATIKSFLDQGGTGFLKLKFSVLEVRITNSPNPLQKVVRYNARLIIYKTAHKPLAKMRVEDNLAFPFSFRFERPTNSSSYNNEVSSLPSPLSHGRLEMDAKKLVLHFTINAPDDQPNVRVRHEYRQLLLLDNMDDRAGIKTT